MAVDDSNVLRVDIEDMINEARHRTELKSRVLGDDAMSQKIVISDDDYSIIMSWLFEVAGLLANDANYIWNAEQSGLDAISDPWEEGEENPNNDVELIDLDTRQKRTSEFLSKGEMDTITFSSPQLTGKTILKYSFVKTLIRSAMIEYILFKWWDSCGVNEDSAKSYAQYENWKDQVRFNSVTNIRNINLTRKVRPMG